MFYVVFVKDGRLDIEFFEDKIGTLTFIHGMKNECSETNSKMIFKEAIYDLMDYEHMPADTVWLHVIEGKTRIPKPKEVVTEYVLE